jgi:hypothetical protein
VSGSSNCGAAMVSVLNSVSYVVVMMSSGEVLAALVEPLLQV